MVFQPYTYPRVARLLSYATGTSVRSSTARALSMVHAAGASVAVGNGSSMPQPLAVSHQLKLPRF